MKHILIVEDDVHIGNILEETLHKQGYHIHRAYSGTEAIYVLNTLRPDLVLLDLMLPGMNGEELLPRIKGVPVIIMSAKVDMDNKVELLLNGAVDYVTKPFDMKELLARISIHLRTRTTTKAEVLYFKELKLNIDTHEVMVGVDAIKLTRTEYAILKLLMENTSLIITKSRMIEEIAEDTPDCSESSLKMHISNLRKKLRKGNDKDYIEAVWGIGFKLKDV